MNHQAGFEYERSFWDQGKHVVGIDEAGRGPIAGPLVGAGAVFDIGYANSEIYDSKALSEKKREKLFSLILREARCYKIKIVTPEEIDTLNIYRATQKAMEEIACEINAEAVLTDAMPLLHCAKPTLSIIKGDQKSLSIAAGSILAKVVRVHIMLGYDCLLYTSTLYGEKLNLTPTEFSILQMLCENRGKVISSQDLFESIWKDT